MLGAIVGLSDKSCSQPRSASRFFVLIGAGYSPCGRAAAMTEKEYEEQQRDLVRVVSACTLGLWSFAAGLLIGTFILF